MTENPRHEIDELLSGYVDEMLTARQQTELKRLLLHQPQLAEQLASLRRLRQLLNALPAEPIPASVVNDVMSRLERNQILRRFDRSSGGLTAKLFLWQRRLAAVAALVFVPLALVGLVVWQIVEPTGKPAEKTVAVESARQSADSVATSLPSAMAGLEGVLTLICDRPLLIAQTIEKELFLAGVDYQAIPERTADKMTFQLRCPVPLAQSFFEQLKPLWGQLTEARFAFKMDGVSDGDVVVEHIVPQQIQMLLRQPTSWAFLSLAKHYAATNTPLVPENQQAVNPPSAPSVEQLPVAQPFLAWPEQPAVPDGLTGQPVLRLTITVCRQTESP